MKKLFASLAVTIITANLFAQVDAGLFRFPDSSQTQIVFTYANDLWVMAHHQLASPTASRSND